MALLLLYQPAGVSDATRWTCEHLVHKGYAPLIISNAPLSEADRALLPPAQRQPLAGLDCRRPRRRWLCAALGRRALLGLAGDGNSEQQRGGKQREGGTVHAAHMLG